MGNESTRTATTPPVALDEHDASHYLGMSAAWLRKARQMSTGPAYIRIGRTIRYRTADLDKFLQQHLVGGAR
jgi:hypothetical protein